MSSFSSFPAFASFPDLEPGPSTRSPTPREDSKEGKGGKEGKRHKKSRRDEDRNGDRERKKRKHKHKGREREDSDGVRHKHSRSRSSTREPERYGLGNDERRKWEEDRAYKKEDPDGRSARQGLVYFTDQKGDPLNERYGCLHDGDVPRHWLVGGKSHTMSAADN